MKKAHFISLKNIVPADALTLGNYDFLPSVYTYGDGVYYIRNRYNAQKFDGYTLGGVLEYLYYNGDTTRKITI